jgi:hypothetical protein
LPATHGLPLGRFSRTELHRLVIERGVTDASASTIWRWLAEDAIKPWQQRSTLFVRDPDCYENLRLIHLPMHASWLNQIEIYFSILQRKAMTPNNFADLNALAARITAFEEHHRQIAQPFDRTFTRQELDRVLAKIADRELTLQVAA